MKFGIFYEISVPRPWSRQAEKKVYDNALEQVKLADELGFEYVWKVNYRVCSNDFSRSRYPTRD